MFNKVIQAIKKSGSSMIVQDDFVSGGIFAYRTNKKVGTPYKVPNEALIEGVNFEYYKNIKSGSCDWWEQKEVARFNRKEFVKAIKAAMYVADTKGILIPNYGNYVRIGIGVDQATVTAVTWQRLFSKKIACKAEIEQVICLHAKELKPALPLLLEGEEIILRENGVIECGNVFVYIPTKTEQELMLPNFRNIEDVLSRIDYSDITVTCNRKELIKIVTAYKKVCKGIALCAKNDLLTVMTKHFYEKEENALPLIYTLPCITSGEIIYGINEQYLLDALNAVDDEEIVLFFSGRDYNMFVGANTCIAGLHLKEVD